VAPDTPVRVRIVDSETFLLRLRKIQILLFPAHGSRDAGPSPGVVKEDELFDWTGVEFPVLAQLQINRGFSIRLASCIEAEDIRFVFLHANPGVLQWRYHEEEK
jgi:hypothetical protein